MGSCERRGTCLVVAHCNLGWPAVGGAEVGAWLGPPSTVGGVQLLAPVSLHAPLLLVQGTLFLCSEGIQSEDCLDDANWMSHAPGVKILAFFGATLTRAAANLAVSVV